MVLISRVFGLIRDIVIARYFGAGPGMDAFFIAFKIPNYLRRLFGEGGFPQAFVPILTEYKTRRNDDVQQLIDHVTGALGFTLFIITVIGVITAPIIIMIFAPGFIQQKEKYDLAVTMLRITFPYILFISLTALAGGILNTYGRFAVPAFTPVLFNISMIICAVWLAPKLAQPVVALAWGVFIAGIVQLLLQFPYLKSLRLFPRPKLKRSHEGVRKVVTQMIPTLFAVSVSQINLIVDMLIASFLVTGSISWLYYSDRLMEFPLGVFGVALATVILPNLSEKHAQGSTEHFNHMLDWGLRWTILISVPATAGLIMLSGPLMITIFHYGEFNLNDVEMAGRSLISYAIGLSGFILIKILSTGFFSRQDTRTPVKAGVIAMLSNIILSLMLVVPLAHAGLALATSLAAFINSGTLYFYLRRKAIYQFEEGWGIFLIRILVACTAMSIILYFFAAVSEDWIQWSAYFRALHLGFLIFLGAMTYFAVLWISGLRLNDMLMDAQRV